MISHEGVEYLVSLYNFFGLAHVTDHWWQGVGRGCDSNSKQLRPLYMILGTSLAASHYVRDSSSYLFEQHSRNIGGGYPATLPYRDGACSSSVGGSELSGRRSAPQEQPAGGITGIGDRECGAERDRYLIRWMPEGSERARSCLYLPTPSDRPSNKMNDRYSYIE